MFSKPDSFGHDAEVWREQAHGFDKAAEAAAAIGEDTATAATEAVWKGPMPDERLARMEEQAGDATSSADLLAQMAQACRTIANEAESASSAVDDIREDWDDGNIIDRFGMGGDADDVHDQFSQQTAGARGALTKLATMLQPVIDRGDPLDYMFNPVTQPPGAPYLGEQIDEQAANDYFETGVLTDPEHVEEIENTINGLPDGEAPPDDWNEWAETNGYTSAEVQAALDELDDEERAALDQWLADNKGGLDSDSTALSSFLLLNMREEQVDEFHNEVPNIEPDLHNQSDGWIDGNVDMTVDADFQEGEEGYDDIDQGGIGDCVTLATLAAATSTDPDFFEEHIRENDNGTYTVTMYDDNGDPVEVTVSGHIPGDGSDPAYNGDDTGEITWASIYEKATAQFHGGSYADIDGGITSDRLPFVTGEPVDRVGLPAAEDAQLYADMEEAFANGGPIGIGGPIPPRNPGDATNHSYAVVGVENGLITVMNPWGGNGAVEVFTIEEFQNANFGYVAITQ